jgi:hypothetical protein
MSIKDEKLFYDIDRFYYKDENYANIRNDSVSTESSDNSNSENTNSEDYNTEENPEERTVNVTPVKYYIFRYSQGQTKVYNSIIFADNPADIERLYNRKIWSKVIIYNSRDRKINVTVEINMYRVTKDNRELLEQVSKDMKTIGPESFQTFHVEYINKDSRDDKSITKKDFLKVIAFLLCIETLDNRIVHIPEGENIALNID